eukprot:SAG11_NODE_2814_length_2944_cov_2.698770_3_plen_42_part_00
MRARRRRVLAIDDSKLCSSQIRVHVLFRLRDYLLHAREYVL